MEAIAVLIIAVNLFALFLYKNRKGQMKIIVMAIVLIIAALGLTGYWYYDLNKGHLGKVAASYGLLFPVVALLLDFMALKGVQKDDKLVRSQDRLR